MATAGRFLIMPKGAYKSDEVYKRLDLVFYNGSSWLCKTPCIDIEPKEINAEYWHNLTRIALANNYTTETEGYALDARKGKELYENVEGAKASVTVLTDAVDSLSAAVNGLMGASIAAEYDPTETYEVGAYVSYNGELFVCIESITEPEVFNIDHWRHCYIMEEIDDKVVKIVEEIVNGEVATQLEDIYASIDEINERIDAIETSLKVTEKTLDIGETTVVFEDERITENTIFSFYTSEAGVNPRSWTAEEGRVTITFRAQTVAVKVGYRIDG